MRTASHPKRHRLVVAVYDEPSSLAGLVLELQGCMRDAILVMQQFLDLCPDGPGVADRDVVHVDVPLEHRLGIADLPDMDMVQVLAVSYTHLRAHETRHDLVCRLLLE